MSGKQSHLRGAWWGKNLDDIDREIARLAAICGVRILDPGIIERVLRNDASVCRSSNSVAFAKLRNALMMHYRIRDNAVDVLGEENTSQLIAEIVERLRARIGEGLGGGPSK